MAPSAHRRALSMLAAALVTPLLLTGCGGGGEDEGRSPAQVMERAKQLYDDASSVRIALSTGSTPEAGNGVLAATGTVTQDPAFQGDVKVVYGGLTATVPITSLNGKVFAKLPLQSQVSVIDPAEYGAPDPADFADPEIGISSLLTRLDGLRKKGQTRSSDTILTTYTGTLPGAAVQKVIPSAVAEETYATRVGVDEKGYATTVKVTGPFFSGGEDVTYDVKLDNYDKDVTITAPTS